MKKAFNAYELVYFLIALLSSYFYVPLLVSEAQRVSDILSKSDQLLKYEVLSDIIELKLGLALLIVFILIQTVMYCLMRLRGYTIKFLLFSSRDYLYTYLGIGLIISTLLGIALWVFPIPITAFDTSFLIFSILAFLLGLIETMQYTLYILDPMESEFY